MNKQMTLGTRGFEKYTRTTRREKFLAEMDRIVPWTELCALIAPHYPKAGDGRPPKELDIMRRIYFLQSGSTSPIRAWRRPFTTRRRCAASAICWSATRWA
ncbi:MAG: IS4 family transposase [Gammaproteobacteria bacterium]|nr:MAG: IS4 family transposase [Gammaproteobacteria bacterium]TND01408.1 MAG: IS4 family transposase [Gammaproteobacteria bacterium]